MVGIQVLDPKVVGSNHTNFMFLIKLLLLIELTNELGSSLKKLNSELKKVKQFKLFELEHVKYI